MFGTPAAFISVIDVPGTLKLVWLLASALAVSFATQPVLWLITSRKKLRDLQRRERLRLSIGFVGVIISVGLAFTSAHVIQRQIDVAVGGACLAPGTGEPEYEEAFREAYQAGGGREELGCPVSPVLPWTGAGFRQQIRGPDGESALAAVREDPGNAVLLRVDELAGLATIRQFANEGIAVAGYPVEEVERLPSGGSMLRLGAGPWADSGLVKKEGGEWYWVQPEVWQRYMDAGGAEGFLGVPRGKG